MFSPIERCKRDVSCVTIPICWRRLSCVVKAMSCPSIRMRPPYVVEAQQKIDQRRLAGARTPNQTDLFPRLHCKREVVDDAASLAVVKPDVLEADRAL